MLRRLLKKIFKPKVYTCWNNGVMAVVLEKDLKEAKRQQGPGLNIVPQTFTFSNLHFPYQIQDIRLTGNITQGQELIKKCEVRERMFYVPLTSGIIDEDIEKKLIRPARLGDAYAVIYG